MSNKPRCPHCNTLLTREDSQDSDQWWCWHCVDAVCVDCGEGSGVGCLVCGDLGVVPVNDSGARQKGFCDG